jgi:hypothetical protein
MNRKKLEPARAVGDIDNVGVAVGLNVGRKLGLELGDIDDEGRNDPVGTNDGADDTDGK